MHKNLFLSLFVSSILFLSGAYVFRDMPPIPQMLVLALIIAAIPVFKFLGRNSLLTFALSSLAYSLMWGLEHISTLYLQVGFLSLAIYFLWEKRAALLKGCGSPIKRTGIGVLLFVFMVIAAILANIILYYAGITDQGKIIEVVSGLPLYLIIISFTLAPVSEELFFRAFLVPRLGIILSTIFFSLVHAAYGSIAEFAGAFFLGLVLGVAYMRLRDPLPCIIAHALFNALSVSVMFWVYG